MGLALSYRHVSDVGLRKQAYRAQAYRMAL
jgi:hypothetical protein